MLFRSVILSKHRCFLAVDNSYGRKQQPRFKYTWSHSILSELAISKREYSSFCCCIIHSTRVLVISFSHKLLLVKVETTTIRYSICAINAFHCCTMTNHGHNPSSCSCIWSCFHQLHCPFMLLFYTCFLLYHPSY